MSLTVDIEGYYYSVEVWVPKHVIKNNPEAKNLYNKHKHRFYPYLDLSKRYGIRELKDILPKFEDKYWPSPLEMYPDEKFWTDTLIPTLWDLYMEHGNPEKVKCFHEWVRKVLEENCFKQEDGYIVSTELNVSFYTCDESGIKRCDIVVTKYGKIVLIIMTKIVMTNYKQNKGNYFDNQFGACQNLVLENPGVKVVPLNIFFTETPYLNKPGIIQKFETIKYENIKRYDILKTRKVLDYDDAPVESAYDVINIIFDVTHLCHKGEKIEKAPTNFKFNVDTPFRSFKDIFNKFLQGGAVEKKWHMIDAQEYEKFKKWQALPNPEK